MNDLVNDGSEALLVNDLDNDGTPYPYDKKCFSFGPVLIFLRISGRARVYRAVFVIKLFSNLATFRPSVLPWLFVPAFRPGFSIWSSDLVWRFGLEMSADQNILPKERMCEILGG